MTSAFRCRDRIFAGLHLMSTVAMSKPIKGDILKKVSWERVDERLRWMGAFVDELLTGIPDLPNTSEIFLNMTLLTSAIRSYFIDVERYKDFHNLKLVERYKVASYSAKWILKCKPIQFKTENPHEMDCPALLALNEMFALKWGLAICGINEASMKDGLLNEILYTFQYRNIAEDSLTLVFKILDGSDHLESG